MFLFVAGLSLLTLVKDVESRLMSDSSILFSSGVLAWFYFNQGNTISENNLGSSSSGFQKNLCNIIISDSNYLTEYANEPSGPRTFFVGNFNISIYLVYCGALLFHQVLFFLN